VTADLEARFVPAYEPPHPGTILDEITLPALGLNIQEAAKALGVSRQTLHNIIGLKQSITPEMSVRLGKLCGTGPGTWARLQLARDLWKAEKRLGSAVDKIPTINWSTAGAGVAPPPGPDMP
jgi:addiction module HigA family antidote